jgi:hypothetical protein
LFRQQDAFFDYRRYKQALAGLNAFFGFFSALHQPTALTAALYPTATCWKPWTISMAHQDPAVNPFIRYYEEVLVPMIADHPPALVGISMVFANHPVGLRGQGVGDQRFLEQAQTMVSKMSWLENFTNMLSQALKYRQITAGPIKVDRRG